ncbi:hypothetical protein [Nocardia altamirensis]|uniref:hypothetical protein n=1 Tax=Nocardia altamirensis TaxID=472158 RepID=UPI00083FFD6B|nr:hypothetical protein [Nocardia altamirensis]
MIESHSAPTSQITFTQCDEEGLTYTAGDRFDEAAPFARFWFRERTGDWDFRVEYEGNPIALARPQSEEAAQEMVHTVFAKFYARRGRSGIAAQRDQYGNCLHAGTVTEDGIEICDNCHRRTSGIEIPF